MRAGAGDRVEVVVGWTIRLTRPGSVILVDNVIRDGQVLTATSEDPRAHAALQTLRMMGDPERPMVRKTAMSAQIRVVAGVNGAGKSSMVGATVRDKGGEYYNPDEAARQIMAANPGLGQTEGNAAAWEQGRKLLQRAIDQGLDFTFETTLGGNTMPGLLAQAAKGGVEVHVFYVGLDSADAPHRAGATKGPRRRA
jgi:Zeta toxin